MQGDKGIWFPDADFFEDIIVYTIPALFPDYEGGVPDFQYLGGSRGRGLFESALAQPKQSFGGEYLYPSISDKAAALIWSTIKNHPFTDGNKRSALTTGFFFLAFNGYMLLARQDEAIELCLKVAAGDFGVDQAYVSEWIGDRIVRLDEIVLSEDLNQNDAARRYIQAASSDEARAFIGTLIEVRQMLLGWAQSME